MGRMGPMGQGEMASHGSGRGGGGVGRGGFEGQGVRRLGGMAIDVSGGSARGSPFFP